jgi:uncharacterized membrane protein
MLSLAVDRQIWGSDTRGYHLTNVLLHILTAVLVAIFLRPLMPTAASALVATLIFALHPLQMEAVSLAIQRKTVLSGAGFFLTLILYRSWRESGRTSLYIFSILSFAAAALAKPMAICLPLILWLYEYSFIGGRPRVLDKLPYLAIGIPIALAAMSAHAAVSALHAPHGGNLAVHVLMMGRVTAEYLAALFVPANLSPIYYYPRASGWAPLNFAAVGAVLLLGTYALLARRRFPWAFFCVAWFALCLLPESNIFPLAQLRADRFLYLSIVGFGIWVGVGLNYASARPNFGRFAYGAAMVALALYSLQTRASASVWRNDVSAWQQVVQRHPWCAMAHENLAVAYTTEQRPALAERNFLLALERSPERAETHLKLARLYWSQGLEAPARLRVENLLQRQPEHADGLALLAEIQSSNTGEVRP